MSNFKNMGNVLIRYFFTKEEPTSYYKKLKLKSDYKFITNAIPKYGKAHELIGETTLDNFENEQLIEHILKAIK